MLEAFIVIGRSIFAYREENVDEGSNSQPALDSSEWNVFIWYESRD